MTSQQATRAEEHPVVKSLLRHGPFIFLLLALCSFLFWPLRNESSLASSQKDKGEDYRIDCLILRDASKSPNAQDYDRIELAIIGHLSFKYGDRASYSTFGTDVGPNGIQALSSLRSAVEAKRNEARKVPQKYDTTNFTLLFRGLEGAIRKDRRKEFSNHRKKHIDTIIILSDGVPDLTRGKNPCPSDKDDFISDEVVQAFKELVTSNYATHEAIKVRLVLVGSKLSCIANIQAEWEDKLGGLGLQVIPYSGAESIDSVIATLLRPFNRHSHISLQIQPIHNSQRHHLDAGERFAVQYSAVSFGQGGSLEVASGSLLNEKGETRLLNALRNLEISSADDDHHPLIRVPSPEDGGAIGTTIDSKKGDYIYLEPDSVKKWGDFLSDSVAYTLTLNVLVHDESGTGPSLASLEPNPPALDIPPCQETAERTKYRLRLKFLYWLFAVLIAALICGCFAWQLSHSAAEGTIRSHIKHFAERTIVRPFESWFEALAVVLLVALIGAIKFDGPWAAVTGTGIFLGLAFYLMHRYEESHWLHRTSATILLPIIVAAFIRYILRW